MVIYRRVSREWATLRICARYHFAFVFDRETLRQSIYLNGALDGSRTATSAYLGTSGDTTIGYQATLSSAAFFAGRRTTNWLHRPLRNCFPCSQGYIDYISIYRGRVKSAYEVKNDASLYAYYSWNEGLPFDESISGANGGFYGLIYLAPGYSSMGLLFTTATAYFMVPGFRIFGSDDHSFSVSIWVNPAAYGGSIIHRALNSDGSGFCFAILGMSSTGQPASQVYDRNKGLKPAYDPNPLPLNVWTQLVATFSLANGSE